VAVFNRRNAAVGWLALLVGKRIVKSKARQAVPAVDPESKRPNKSAIALMLAAAVGAATFWRRRSDHEETGQQP
jgi:MYXO-CTERM domain-containing protein